MDREGGTARSSQSCCWRQGQTSCLRLFSCHTCALHFSPINTCIHLAPPASIAALTSSKPFPYLTPPPHLRCPDLPCLLDKSDRILASSPRTATFPAYSIDCQSLDNSLHWVLFRIDPVLTSLDTGSLDILCLLFGWSFTLPRFRNRKRRHRR